jgi:hypothetical protein
MIAAIPMQPNAITQLAAKTIIGNNQPCFAPIVVCRP